MTYSIRFFIPGQPQGKGRAKIVKIAGFSRMATPQKTVAYEGLVAMVAQTAMRLHGYEILADGPVACSLDITCQVPASWSKRKGDGAVTGVIRPTTKPDIDNVVKAIFDGLNGVLWRDDVQVVTLSAIKSYGPTPGVWVYVNKV